jgi:hypothetical protein
MAPDRATDTGNAAAAEVERSVVAAETQDAVAVADDVQPSVSGRAFPLTRPHSPKMAREADADNDTIRPQAT